MLAKIKADFWLFKYHKPTAIFAIFLVFLHFVAALADNYKWGKQLVFSQYLGFSFSDKWLTLLSFGTLAFYLMLLVGLTSATKSIQFLGFRNWKKIHYLSYPAFFIAFTHSFNLGTDIKTSFLAPVIHPLVLFTFLLVIALLLARIAHGVFQFSDQWEINLAVILFILLVIGSLFFASNIAANESKISDLNSQVYSVQSSAKVQQAANAQNIGAPNG